MTMPAQDSLPLTQEDAMDASPALERGVSESRVLFAMAVIHVVLLALDFLIPTCGGPSLLSKYSITVIFWIVVHDNIHGRRRPLRLSRVEALLLLVAPVYAFPLFIMCFFIGHYLRWG